MIEVNDIILIENHIYDIFYLIIAKHTQDKKTFEYVGSNLLTLTLTLIDDDDDDDDNVIHC